VLYSNTETPGATIPDELTCAPKGRGQQTSGAEKTPKPVKPGFVIAESPRSQSGLPEAHPQPQKHRPRSAWNEGRTT